MQQVHQHKTQPSSRPGRMRRASCHKVRPLAHIHGTRLPRRVALGALRAATRRADHQQHGLLACTRTRQARWKIPCRQTLRARLSQKILQCDRSSVSAWRRRPLSCELQLRILALAPPPCNE